MKNSFEFGTHEKRRDQTGNKQFASPFVLKRSLLCRFYEFLRIFCCPSETQLNNSLLQTRHNTATQSLFFLLASYSCLFLFFPSRFVLVLERISERLLATTATVQATVATT